MTDIGAEAAARSRGGWRDTVLAGLANYIDSGAIVAGAVALAMWQQNYQLDDGFLGLIGALGPNAIGAAVGALIGGWLCDRLGRRTIYQWDMLLYAFGMAFLVFAAAPWMILTGYLIVGVAVGADIPASWSLIAEQAPDDRRARHSGFAQVLWYLAPLVVLLLTFVLSDLGALGTRIVFGHLLLIALGLSFLRARMNESGRWERARASTLSVSALFKGQHLRSILALVGMYGFWNLWAGSAFFFPYILESTGTATHTQSIAIQLLNFVLGIGGAWLVFMRFADRIDQRRLFLTATLIQLAGTLTLIIFPLHLYTAVLYVVITASAGGFGAQSFFQLWSAEMFPTLLRSTAQGFCYAVVRLAMGIFSVFVPLLAATEFTSLVLILSSFLAVSALIGAFWAPRNEGKSLEQLEAERAGG